MLINTGSNLVYTLSLNFVETDLARSNPTVSDNFATSSLSIALRENDKAQKKKKKKKESRL